MLREWAEVSPQCLESELRYLLSAMVVKWVCKHQIWRRWRCSHKGDHGAYYALNFKLGSSLYLVSSLRGSVGELAWYKKKLLSSTSEGFKWCVKNSHSSPFIQGKWRIQVVCEEQPPLTIYTRKYLDTQWAGARLVLPNGDGKRPREKGRLRPVQKESSKKTWYCHEDGAIAQYEGFKWRANPVTPHRRKREVSLNSIQFIILKNI